MGQVIKASSADDIFIRPRDPRTRDYVIGRFG